MSFRSRLGAAWRGLTTKDGPNGPYGALGLLAEIFGARTTKSGQAVTVARALEVATVLACVRVLADGIAQVPLKLYREREDGRGSDPAREHPLYGVLYRRPNAWQTSFAFRETMMLHLVLCSNFYALKVLVRGRVAELVPIDPVRVSVKRNPDLTIAYKVRDEEGGPPREIPASAIWHVRGPSWNSWMGMEAVKLARESIGLSMAIEADQARLYANGLRTSGTYSVDGVLTPAQYTDLRKFIKEYQEDDRGGPLILDHAAKYLQQSLSSVDAQTLESRRLQVEEVCRPFRVMPIMVGHADKTATYASAEQMFLAHVVHTLAPWCERIEQAIDNDLLDAESDAAVYAKFSLNGLMRGAFSDRMTGYSKALGAGGSPAWMTPNEIRAFEEMNPIDGGDELPRPANPPPPGDPRTPPPPNGDV
jgi:HK97 family phage portal protein